MDSDQIKRELRAKGFDFSLIAEALGKSPSLVSKVAARKARSRPVAQALAKALGLSVKEVFPDVPEYAYDAMSPTEKAAKREELKALLNSD